MAVAAEADKFNCSNCPWGRHCDDNNPAPFAKWVIEGEIESRTCLLPMITEQSRFLMDLHKHYKDGLLPYAGGVLNQPHYYLQAMRIISAAFARARSDG